MSSGSLEVKACCSKEETMAVQASLIKGTEAASEPGYKASTAQVKEPVDDASSPLSAKKQKLSSGLIDLYSEDEEDIEVTGYDGDDYGYEDVEYFASFFKKQESVGDLIREKLATVVDESSKSVSSLDSDEIKCLFDKYGRPSYIDNLVTPDRNQEFRPLQAIRLSDNGLAFVQKLIVKCMCAALSLCEDLYTALHSKASSDLKSVYFKSLDLVTLLIATFTNTCRKRQDAYKYVLDPRFKSLCNDASSSDGLLFGPDFQKLLREVTENSKISPFAPGVLKNSLTLLSRRRGRGRFTRGQSYQRSSQGRTGIHGQLPRPSNAS
ncbi:hypothetical protein ElyMa_006648800 [Elysia marginata]|uniref:Uncharacterized protein n=1 Tax=Elysia marginata TaxID=1093978 RepID=A0AAV4IEL6_9GAST|nr:hypothetical protein ElyMa_006648800 [Elysia marginata]